MPNVRDDVSLIQHKMLNHKKRTTTHSHTHTHTHTHTHIYIYQNIVNSKRYKKTKLQLR